MRFNLDVTIDGVHEEYQYGDITYPIVQLTCLRSCGEVFIKQDGNIVHMNSDQAEELYKQLHSVFGEIK